MDLMRYPDPLKTPMRGWYHRDPVVYPDHVGRRAHNFSPQMGNALSPLDMQAIDPRRQNPLAVGQGYLPHDSYGFNWESDCDYRLGGPKCERDPFFHGHHSCGRTFHCNGSHSDSKKEYPLKTKDISVRGKTYAVRKSFLADSGKFESDLGKYMDKKKEEEVPDHVVQILIDFINTEECNPKSLLDLVTMNILASILGVKSAVDYSLTLIKKFADADRNISGSDLTDICGITMLSGKVDDGLKGWLKKFLTSHNRFYLLERYPTYAERVANHPELHTRLEEMLGLRDRQNDEGFRIL